MGGANDFFAFSGGLPKGHITKYPLLYFGLSKLREEGDGGGAKKVGLVKMGGANFFSVFKGLAKSGNTWSAMLCLAPGGTKGAGFVKVGGSTIFLHF